jgi:phage-related holin
MRFLSLFFNGGYSKLKEIKIHLTGIDFIGTLVAAYYFVTASQNAVSSKKAVIMQ